MVRIPVVKSRRINKIMCLTFLVISLLMFAVAGGFFLFGKDTAFSVALCVPAGIMGLFSLLYGILWFVYLRKEAKKQKLFERVSRFFDEPSDGRIEYKDFLLPHEALVSAAKTRFRKFSAGLGIAMLVVFTLLYTYLLITIGYQGVGHLLLVLAFCIIIPVPGCVMQYIIYRKYADLVPQRIRLFPGKLIIDDVSFSAGTIERISVTSSRPYKAETAALFRSLSVKSRGQSRVWNIDYRVGMEDSPRWKQYDEFLFELKKWAELNRVSLTVDYMQ